MKVYTLGFLFKDNKIILAKKKRKFGIGKWNGYGGKVEDGEDLKESLVREINEECGVSVLKEDCVNLGVVDFIFENNDEKNQRVFMYRIDNFLGFPKETDEMSIPELFNLDQIPYNEMLIGDDKFMHFILLNEKFQGKILFNEDGSLLINHEFLNV